MAEETVYKGVWWLPDRPESQVAGELTIAPNNEARLELRDCLKDEVYSNRDLNPALLLGLTSSGKEVTLYRCFSTSLTYGTSGFPTSRFRAQFVFVGAHFEKEQDLRFKELSISYAHLDEWVDRTAFKYEETDKNGSFLIRYAQSAPVVAKLGDYEITVRPCYSMSQSRIRVELNQTAMIDLCGEEERPLDPFLTISRRIQDFLSLGMGVGTHPLRVFGRTDQVKSTLGGSKQISSPIEIHYEAIGWISDIKEVHSFNMPFTLSRIQERIDTYLGNWITKSDLLAPVYSLFFAALYNPHEYPESIFLSLVQAVETYHRRRFAGKYQTDEEFQHGLFRIFVDNIPQALDRGFRDALVGGKLKYANEFSLRKRLQDLTQRVTQYVAKGFLSSKSKTGMFIEDVCNTRNYLTHYTPELEGKSAQSGELYALSQRLRGILELCLFEEIGFDIDTIRRIVNENRRYILLLN